MEPGHTSEDRRRGRVERRRCWAFGDDFGDWLEGHAQWQGLRSVAAVELEREEKGVTTVERRYFITSLAPDAKRLAEVVRARATGTRRNRPGSVISYGGFGSR